MSKADEHSQNASVVLETRFLSILFLFHKTYIIFFLFYVFFSVFLSLSQLATQRQNHLSRFRELARRRALFLPTTKTVFSISIKQLNHNIFTTQSHKLIETNSVSKDSSDSFSKQTIYMQSSCSINFFFFCYSKLECQAQAR